MTWKRSGWLTPFVPHDVAQHFAPGDREANGLHTTLCFSLSGLGYNTNLVKREDAPTSFADLLDPKWQGKIVKGNPDYSGSVFTATFALSRDLGWSYFERLAQQKVVQVQSSRDPPNRLARGDAPCKPTVPTPNSCCCENVARRWKLSTPVRVRR